VQKCSKIRLQWGFAPDLSGVAYNAPPDRYQPAIPKVRYSEGPLCRYVLQF